MAGTVKGRRVGWTIGGVGESGVTVLEVWTVNGRVGTGTCQMVEKIL